MTTPTDVSIIIVHYNTDEDTKNCLRSLSKIDQTGLDIHVVIVDNGSQEPFSFNPKGIQSEVVRSESNLGFTGGNNFGIHYSIEKYNSDYVLLLNSDTEVDSQFLVEMVNTMKANPRMGIASPKIYFMKGQEYHKGSYSSEEKGNVIWYGGGSIDWTHLVAFHRGVDEVDFGQFDEYQTSDFSTGCCALLKREVLEKIGGFDKRYFLYFEDVDLSLRALEAGYEIGFIPEGKVWHANAGSSGGSGSKLQQYYQTRNRYLFVSLHARFSRWKSALRLMIDQLVSGSNVERIGILHFITRKFGKQQLV